MAPRSIPATTLWRRRASAALTGLALSWAQAAHANVFSCSGFAVGPGDAGATVWIIPSDHTTGVDWRPPRIGDGPLRLTLSYAFTGGVLGEMQEAKVQAELTLAAFAADGRGRLTMTVDALPSWNQPWQAERDGLWRIDLAGGSAGQSVPFGDVRIASLRQLNTGAPPIHPERLSILESAVSIDIAGYGHAGDRFSRVTYDLSDNGACDMLFRQAYARAQAALASKPHQVHCQQDMCECGG